MNSDNRTHAGHVRVYQYTDNNWQQLGSDIDGEATLDQSGWSVSLSADGTILAIGALYNDANGTNSGHVRVYQYTDNNWEQMGYDIDGDALGINAATGISCVSLSANGKIVAFGTNTNDGNGSHSGHVRMYQYTNNNWQQLGYDIEGEVAHEHSGRSVSLSADGSIVAIGANYSNVNGRYSGRVYIYELI